MRGVIRTEAPTIPHSSRFGAWLWAVTVGELLGSTSTALIAFLALTLGGRPATTAGRVAALLIMVVAGTLEGASLGSFQWRALRQRLGGSSA